MYDKKCSNGRDISKWRNFDCQCAVIARTTMGVDFKVIGEQYKSIQSHMICPPI